MAIGLPFHEHSWSPAGVLPEATPGVRERRGSGPCAPAEGALDLGLVRAAIQDGLLMVFGPDGDPVPPQVFGAVAAEQPDAGVRLVDGPPVRAEHIAAVLDAQTRGRLGSDPGGDEAWIRAMLAAPQPEMVGDEDLRAERCTLDVVAFGRELMITSPNGATFLLAAARSRRPDSISLRVAGEGPVALGGLAARLLASDGRDQASLSPNEFAAPDCPAWLEGDALRIDLPEVGAVDLARADEDAAAAPSVSLFMASGEVATIDDLLSTLSRSVPLLPATGYADSRDPPSPQCDADGQPPHPVPLTIGLPGTFAAEPDRVALVVLRGLPKGASLSAGVESGDGSWLLSPRDLPGLALMPPPDWASDLALKLAAIAIANAAGELTSAAQTVSVPLRSAAVAPAPSRAVAPAPPSVVAPAPFRMVEAGASPMIAPAPSPTVEPAHASIPLGLDAQLLSGGGPFDAVIVRDLPAGVALSAGTYDPAIAGWVLLPRQLTELSVITPGGHNADFTLSLLGVCLRPGGGARPRVLARVPVTIE
jgi:hypothetical protein